MSHMVPQIRYDRYHGVWYEMMDESFNVHALPPTVVEQLEEAMS